MHKYVFFFLFVFSFTKLIAQDNPFIRLVELTKPVNTVTKAKQFIIGSTCKTCLLTINENKVKVYSTGAFAYEINLNPGDTSFLVKATNAAEKTVTKTIGFSYALPKPVEAVKTLGIESIQTYPEGNLILNTGDKIQFKVKAYPGCNVSAINGAVLYELPTSVTKGMAGIYQGEYIIKATDSFAAKKIPIAISKDGQLVVVETKNTFAILNPLSSDVCITKGRLAHLLYGLGDDRLGGAKIGYIDSMIPLKIIGKVGGNYKVQLAPYKTAYIPDDVVTLAPKGTFAGSALTERWQVFGDSVYDYVAVGLTSKLPYQSVQEIEPSKIVVDVFGATNNTNWITQLQTCKEIKNVTYEQIQDGVFRITIFLNHKQLWGHSVYYKGNLLIIKIKQQPQNLALKNLTFAVDAGHGGSNTGAGGPTGASEKEITLALSLKLQQALQKEGAKVIMTRVVEKFVDNKERILIYRDNTPDLLISIHLNSSADPINVGGTSSMYKYIGFKNLSSSIHKRMLELGLKEYGNIGAFNFMLNSPTEYPNALVETLFLSNPAEEELVLNPVFQDKMIAKILLGIKDFLGDVARDK
ncbi:MAG: N-acetylmuramoyl-L-alanine amidase [Ferruginibacter sp.]|nr:N-acetylmuramoyl-L-alanine amidase [Ferruginibacter sp.]